MTQISAKTQEQVLVTSPKGIKSVCKQINRYGQQNGVKAKLRSIILSYG